jgi:hypothetical protein
LILTVSIAGLIHSLNAEVKHLGIRVCYIEPELFRTAVFSHLLKKSTEPPVDRTIDDYNECREGTGEAFASIDGSQNGDPDKLGKLLVEVTYGTGSTKGKLVPDALAVGRDKYPVHCYILALQHFPTELNGWYAICSGEIQ